MPSLSSTWHKDSSSTSSVSLNITAIRCPRLYTTMGVHGNNWTFAVIWTTEATLMRSILVWDIVGWLFEISIMLRILLYGMAIGFIYLPAKGFLVLGIIQRSNVGILILNPVITVICLVKLLPSIVLFRSITGLIVASILL